MNLTIDVMKIYLCAFVLSKLDYCNSGSPKQFHTHTISFPTKPLSVVTVVILDWLNVTWASRHYIIDLSFTHYFSNSYDIINNGSEITQRLVRIHTHERRTRLYMNSQKYIATVCFHT